MNKLMQLGVLAILFLATACQGSSPQNQDHTTTAKAAVQTQPSPTSTTAMPEKDTQEQEFTTQQTRPATPSPEVKTLSNPTEEAAPTNSTSPAKSSAVVNPDMETSTLPQTPATKATKTVQDNTETEALTPVEQATEAGAIDLPTEATTPPPPAVSEPAVDLEPPPSHQIWNKLLNQYVSATGKVDYQGLKAKSAELEAYLKLLADHPVQDSWSRNEKMAYWINAYNAFTVKLILDNYPLSSITNLSGGKVWDKKWIQLGDQTYSLNHIENDILRPRYQDARIHFAVNCAAQSCPPLLNQAWTADNLNGLLNQQAKKFINNPSYNQIKANKVVISKIFDWYAVDFGNIVDYLNKYSNAKIKPNAQVSYQEYDWALNQ